MAWLTSGWGTDGPLGLALDLATVWLALLYLAGTVVGQRRDRRGRRWPARRTASCVAAVAVLILDLDSPLGAAADTHLAAHMVEHMMIWLVVAPLLCAAAPVRLAFFALGREDRRRLARLLHWSPVRWLTGPVGSLTLFGAVVLVTALPAVYGLTERSELVHICEHALYLVTASLVWAPTIGVDPCPIARDPSAGACCLLGCMVPMTVVSLWLLTRAAPVYPHLALALGTAGALHDQRLAGVIMLAASLPAFAVVPLCQLIGRPRLVRVTPVGAAGSVGPVAESVASPAG